MGFRRTPENLGPINESVDLKMQQLSEVDKAIKMVGAVGKWITAKNGPLELYARYKDSMKYPLAAFPAEEKLYVMENFPETKSPFDQETPTLKFELKDKFLEFCREKNINANLDEFVAQFNDVVQNKSFGEVSVYRLNDSFIRLLSALEKFRRYLEHKDAPVIKRSTNKGSYKPQVPWYKERPIPIKPQKKKK